MSKALLVSAQGALVRISLNRPERKNALDQALVTSLGEALDAAFASDDTRVVILEGTGGSFCSGADLSSMNAGVQDAEARIEEFHRMIRSIAFAPCPVLARIDGPAVGFGADLALACDMRVFSKNGYLQDSFVRIGLMPDGGGTFFLPQLVGVGRALEYLLLGTRLDAEKCLELGLANRVVESEALEATLTELATTLAESAPLAVRAIKRAVRESSRDALLSALAREKSGQAKLLASEDLREGIGAFLGKRPPRFLGR